MKQLFLQKRKHVREKAIIVDFFLKFSKSLQLLLMKKSADPGSTQLPTLPDFGPLCFLTRAATFWRIFLIFLSIIQQKLSLFWMRNTWTRYQTLVNARYILLFLPSEMFLSTDQNCFSFNGYIGSRQSDLMQLLVEKFTIGLFPN